MGQYRYAGSWPDTNFNRVVADVVDPPLFGNISGEVAITYRGMLLGSTRHPGKVRGVILSALSMGKDDTSSPTITADVKINGVTCLSTQPALAHISGEAAMQKTTDIHRSGESAGAGSVSPVINHAANSFYGGDVLTWDLVYTGNAAPTTKAHNVSIIVELDPVVDL